MKSIQNLTSKGLLVLANLASSGAKLFGYADQVVFYRTLAGSVTGLFAFTFNSKLHAVALCNDGAGWYFLFVPKSVLISQFKMASAYVQGFEEVKDAGITTAAQESQFTPGVLRITNISASDAAGAINTINAIEKGTIVYPTTDGYFYSTNGALPSASALPITTAGGTVPEKRINSSDTGEKGTKGTGDKPTVKSHLQKNWGWYVGGLALAVVVFVLVRNR